MATAPTGAAAEAAATEHTDHNAANPAAEAADSRHLTGDSAPDDHGPDAPTSLEALLASGKPEDLERAAIMLESGQDFTEAEGVAETDAHEDGEAEEQPEAAEANDDADDAEPADDAPKGKATPRRIQIHRFDPKSQALLIAAQDYVRENPGTDLRAALEKVGMEFKATAAEAAVAESPRTAPEPVAPVADVQAKLDDLEKQFDEADAAFDIEAKKTLRRQIRAAEQELAEARAETRVAERQLQAKVDEQTALVASVIPDMAREGTPLAKRAASLYADMKASQPAFFKHPEWPKKFAALVWLDVNPDQPMPALVRGRAADAAPTTGANGRTVPAEKPRVPVKQGRSVAMLSTGNGGQDVGSLAAKVQTGRATNEELDRYAMLLEGRA